MITKGSVLITGATDGIGYALAEELAYRYESVIVHGRNCNKCENAVETIKRKTGNEAIYPLVFDLRSMSEIEKGAEHIMRTFPNLKVLINNAGVFEQESAICENGIESMFMVNHFSHFIITNRLLEHQNTEIEQVINTSSLAHLHVKFNESSIFGMKKFNCHKVYGSSKLYCLMHARMLSEKWKERGIRINCYDPGFIDTKLTRSGWDSPPESNMQNAINTVLAILNQEFRSGDYVGDLQLIESSKCSQDISNIQILWEHDMKQYERMRSS